MAKRKKADEGYKNPVLESPDNPVAANVGKENKKKTDKDEQAEKVQKTVRRLLEEAVQFYEQELEPDQVTATEYFKGELFGDEKEGRSKVVNTVLRDAVLAAIPSLMRIVYEAENVAEYKPRPKTPELVQQLEEQAKQATDYVRYIVTEENQGFTIFWNWIMDALVRRIGTVKWWWEDTYRKTQIKSQGLTEQELLLLASDPEVEIESGKIRQTPDGPVFDITAFHVKQDGCAKFQCIPNEEFGFTANARSLEEARTVYHSRELASDEMRAILITAGMDPEDADDLIAANKGKKRTIGLDDLDAARQFDGVLNSMYGQRSAYDDAEDDVVLYTEAYIVYSLDDEDEDRGLRPERRLFKCIGPKFEILPDEDGEYLGEIADDLPFATWTPIPEPHTIVGQSFWDLLKDLQRIISQIERGQLDSLAQAITPVTEVVANMVNMQDFIHPEIAGIRRVRQIGMTNNIVHHFVGGDTLPVLDYYAGVIEDRTGKNKGAMGLDADALQSTTKVAAASILSASQARVEIIARVFAETGLKPLFRGLLKLVTAHQNQSKMVRLRGKYVQIDPRTWDATMDVVVNVALGAGTPSDKIEVLAGIATKQQELMGIGSPFVSNVELRYTMGKIAELSGQKNTEMFFKPWGQHEEAQMQQQKAQQPPPPDPNMALVEVEKQKAAADMAIQEQKFQLEQWKAQREDDRERDRMAQDAVLRELEIEKKYHADINDAQVELQTKMHRAALDADVKRERAQAQPVGVPA